MFDDTAGTDRLCGFFDFYFAGTDALLFDVAVCLNDWCTDLASGQLDEARAAVFTAAYERVRPFTGGEVRALPRCCAPPRCAFGSRACGTGTCRASAALLQPRIRRSSNGCCAAASPRPGTRQDKPPMTLLLKSVPAARGPRWIADAFRLFARKPLLFTMMFAVFLFAALW